MKRRPLFHARAVDDVRNFADYLALTSLMVAERFPGAVRATANDLAEYPGLGREALIPEARLEGLRVIGVRGFRMARLYYMIGPETIEVVRVIPAAMDAAAELGRG